MKKVKVLKKNINIAKRNKSKENNYFYNMFLCTYYSMCPIVSDFKNPKSFT